MKISFVHIEIFAQGNNGERGSLVVTNLRILWICHSNSKINLSIGLNTVLSINIRKANSKLRGNTQALCVLAKFNSRFEFVFTSLVKNSPRLFTTTQAVMRAYETSKLYRDLKLRGSVIKDGDLILLPGEQVYNKISGVWNLSSEQGNLGTFFLSNIRLVWHAHLASNFNVSVPYMQVKSIKIRESKFGKALVLETFSKAGGYVLGFKIDPPEKLQEAFTEVVHLHEVFAVNPIFGVNFVVEEETPSIQAALQPRIEEDVALVEEAEESNTLAAYYVDGVDAESCIAKEILFDSKLGLAFESIQDGVSLEQLWRVI